MKNIISSLVALVLFGMSAVAADSYTTVTNRGQVMQITTLTDTATNERDIKMYQDFSIYPSRLGQTGKIIRWYDFDKLGGAVGTTKLLPAVAIPKGVVVRDGYIYTLTGVTPAITSTNSIQLVAANDIVSACSNLAVAAGIGAIVPVGTTATAKITTADSYVQLVTVTTPLTAGKFAVVLDCELAP